jgi:hypothetical protein
MDRYQIRLADGRIVIFEESSEEAAIRAAQRWMELNPFGEQIDYYEVTLENGDIKRIPAVSEDAALQFVSAWGPQQRALADAESFQFGGMDADGNPLNYDAASNAINNATLGLDKILLASSAAGVTGLRNLVGEGPGYGMEDAFNAFRQAQNTAQRDYLAENPAEGLFSGLLGGAAMPGSRQLANFGLRGVGGANTAAQAARGVVAGAPIGAVSGALNADPGEEAQGAGFGATVGAITGGGVPVAARTATGAARVFGTPTRQMLNTMTGGNVPGLRGGGADRQAMIRLAETMRRDGLDEQTVRAALNNVLTRGMDTNLLDIVGPNATRTRALIQGAALKPGPAQTLATQYRTQVATDLPDRVIDRAYELTPGNRQTAAAYREGLEGTRDQLAEVDYAPVYQQRVAVDPRIEEALADLPTELAQARRTAQLRRDPQRVQEIEGLMDPDEIIDDVSAATLDRIQRRLGTSGRNLERRPIDPDVETAAGYYSRQGSINEVLDEIPELAPARATYRGYQTALNASDAGLDALRPTTRPADYARQLAEMEATSQAAAQTAQRTIPTAMEGAGVGLRDQIVNTVGNMPEGSTGFLNRLGTARNPTEVLEATYGPAAKPFQEDINRYVQSLQNARFIDPGTGSQSYSRIAAEDLVDPLPQGKTQMIMGLVNRIRRGATLTDAEREAIVRMSTQPLSPNGIPISVDRRPSVSGGLLPMFAGQGG